MSHTHKYETISRHGVTAELMELGIQAAEIRRCKQCLKEMTFVQMRKGEWVPVYNDTERSEQDILMA